MRGVARSDAVGGAPTPTRCVVRARVPAVLLPVLWMYMCEMEMCSLYMPGVWMECSMQMCAPRPGPMCAERLVTGSRGGGPPRAHLSAWEKPAASGGGSTRGGAGGQVGAHAR